MILVNSQPNEQDDKDQSMLISIGRGPVAGDPRPDDRGSSSRSSSYRSCSSSRRSSDEDYEDLSASNHHSASRSKSPASKQNIKEAVDGPAKQPTTKQIAKEGSDLMLSDKKGLDKRSDKYLQK